MQQHKIRRVPIADEQNRLIGIIAQAAISVTAKREKVHQTVATISKAQPSLNSNQQRRRFLRAFTKD
jgi:CBS-domain-containing membrane protein